LELVERMWSAVGCRLLRLEPTVHDQAVAVASHLPHLMACATAGRLNADAAPVAAGGFRDTTRVAAGSPDLWCDILRANRAAVGLELTAAISALQRLQVALEGDDPAAITGWLAEGQAGRQRFVAAQPAPG
jgi:prephenate dehydrogenase